MKYFLIFFLFCFSGCTNTSAAVPIFNSDSSLIIPAHKHSRQHFLENYGKDDTSRALINYFFKKRKIAFLETVGPVAVGGVSAILLNSFINQVDQSDNIRGSGEIVAIIPLGFVVLLSGAYIIDGQINWLVFNQRKLLRLLETYNRNDHLSYKITRRKMFKQELQKLKK